MQKTKNIIIILGLCCIIMVSFTACGNKNNTIIGLVVSNKQYTEQADIEKAKEQTEFSAGTNLYASVYFVESPKGMKYTAKWLLDDKEIKSDEKEMLTDKRGAIIYSLEADKVVAGKLELQILYGDEVLVQKQYTIQ